MGCGKGVYLEIGMKTNRLYCSNTLRIPGESLWDGFTESNVYFKVLLRLSVIQARERFCFALLRHVYTTFLYCRLMNMISLSLQSRANDLLMGLDFT